MQHYGGVRMAGTNNVKALRIALVAIGIIFIVGVYPLTILAGRMDMAHSGHRIICR